MLEEKEGDSPRISVIVPVYNVEKYLNKCIDSILLQKFSNYELLLIDDGSTDNSSEICKTFALQDHRVKYFRKKNGGLSDARNFGIERAIAKYIVFIDSDDYIDVDYLLSLYTAIINNAADVAICGFRVVDDKYDLIDNVSVSDFEKRKKIISGKDLLRNVFKRKGYAFVVAWNKIYNRKLFDTVKFEKGRLYEDEYINFKLFWNVKKIALVNRQNYNYVQRDGSIKNSKISKKKIIDIFEVYQRRMEFYKLKDDNLYHLANVAYRKLLLRMYYDFIHTFPSLKKSIQIKYRKLRKMDSYTIRISICTLQDWLAYVSLPLAAFLRRIIIKLKCMNDNIN